GESEGFFFISNGGILPLWKICMEIQQAKDEAVQYSPQKCLNRAMGMEAGKQDSILSKNGFILSSPFSPVISKSGFSPVSKFSEMNCFIPSPTIAGSVLCRVFTASISALAPDRLLSIQT